MIPAIWLPWDVYGLHQQPNGPLTRSNGSGPLLPPDCASFSAARRTLKQKAPGSLLNQAQIAMVYILRDRKIAVKGLGTQAVASNGSRAGLGIHARKALVRRPSVPARCCLASPFHKRPAFLTRDRRLETPPFPAQCLWSATQSRRPPLIRAPIQPVMIGQSL